MKKLFFTLTLIGIFSLPIFGYIYISHFLGTVLGILIGILFFIAWNHSRKAVNAGMTKELFIEIATGITAGHLSAVTVALIVWGIAALDNQHMKEPFWSFAPFYYYCKCLPAGGLFGFLINFGYMDFQGSLKNLKIAMDGKGDFWDDYYWRNQKFFLKYLNPIVLPISPVIFLVKVIIAMTEVVRERNEMNRL